MYLRYYRLRELPFELTPNPRFLYLTPGHREAFANLTYGLSAGKAVTVLIGEAGTGKTTLLRKAIESCPGTRSVCLSNPGLTREEFVETLGRGFGLSDTALTSKATLLASLEPILRERRSRGEMTALIVDEAQCLSYDLLEEVRLLANIETDTEKLLPLVLVGQPELAERLNERALRQLKQRIALRCHVAPFTLGETGAYIASRIRTAGGEAARLFTREAVTLIHESARGIPRTISVICDNALLSGFAAERQPVDRDLVIEVVRDFDLRPELSDTFVALPVDPTPDPASESLAPDAVTDASATGEASGLAMFADAARRRRFSLFGSSS